MLHRVFVTRVFVTVAAAMLSSALPARAAESARYRIDITVRWSAETHPYDFFPNAHLTRFIGATHSDRYSLFADGRTASSGLQSVAERGRIEILRVEMEDAKERERVGDTFEGGGFATPGAATTTFTATADTASSPSPP